MKGVIMMNVEGTYLGIAIEQFKRRPTTMFRNDVLHMALGGDDVTASQYLKKA